GVDLKCGPDGDVYVSDWTDLGECHDRDGVHRTSGRIYKICYGQPSPRPALLDRPLRSRTDLELVELQLHANDWFVRRARRLLQERAASGQDLSDARLELRDMLSSHPDVTRRLRALWALHVTGGCGERELLALLDDAEETVRSWAVRLLVESPPSDQVAGELARLAAREHSGLVRLHLASALQRIGARSQSSAAAEGEVSSAAGAEARWPLALALAKHAEDAEDRMQPLMIWYGIEPVVQSHAELAIGLAAKTPIRLLRRHIARRLVGQLDNGGGQGRDGAINLLLHTASGLDVEFRHDVLQGLSDGLRGWRKAPMPRAWTAFRASLPDDPKLARLASELAVVFGDGREMKALREAIRDGARETSERRAALRVLLESRPADLVDDLLKLLADRSMNDLAVAGLAQYDDPRAAKQILNRYRLLRPDGRTQAISTLSSRKSFAVELLRAVEAKQVPREDITASQARQLAALEDEEVSQLLAQVWGAVRTTPAEKLRRLDALKQAMTAERLGHGDHARGHQLFKQHCASCHRLFGEGQSIAPDLTGGNRGNLDYLLQNIVDPAAEVPSVYRMSVLRLDDGRVVSGVVVRDSGPVLVVQTAKERLNLPVNEVVERKFSELSLMPDNLLELISEDELVNLLAYVQRRTALPPTRADGEGAGNEAKNQGAEAPAVNEPRSKYNEGEK
ncbi:MAG: c-type cytochrome, partial [Planctomycetales bacterium]|nr:c-type cytochrome [Planctomycetales bacterium]